MKILFLTQLLPYPPVCGGTIRSFNVLKHLCKMHEVTLISYVRNDPAHESMAVLRDLCRNVYTCKINRSRWLNLKDAATSVFGGKSFIISRDWTDEMQQTVDWLLCEESFDLIYVDHLQMSQFVRTRRDCLKLLDEHNVEWNIIRKISENESSRAKKAFAAMEWPKLRSYELKVCSEFDMVFTVTEDDKRTLVSESKGVVKSTCVPIGVDMEAFEQVDLSVGSKTILSIATMSWPPNIDAAYYFYRDIFPLVKKAEPDARLVLAGSKPPAGISSIAESDPSVSVPGFVEDMRSLAADAAVFIVPLRSGSGMRVKILNAMALGLPVVSTSLGCEGIPAADGSEILIADDPDDFAAAIMSLLADPKLRFRIAANGRKFVEKCFDWQTIFPRLDEALEELTPHVGRGIST